MRIFCFEKNMYLNSIKNDHADGCRSGCGLIRSILGILELSSEKNHTFNTIWKSWFSYEPPLLLSVCLWLVISATNRLGIQSLAAWLVGFLPASAGSLQRHLLFAPFKRAIPPCGRCCSAVVPVSAHGSPGHSDKQLVHALWSN